MNKEYYIIGWHPIAEALETGKQFQRIFLLQGSRGEKQTEVLKFAKEREIPIQFVPQQKLDRITRKNHQGVIAVVSPIEFADVDNLIASLYEQGESPKFMALDGVTDVRNFGAICRSAECLGFHGILIPSSGMAPINEDAVKSSSGALLRLPVCRISDMGKTLKSLQQQGLQLAGMTEKATQKLSELSIKGPLCIVMGNEETGLTEASLRTCDYLVRIPMKGRVASLNVSVSAAIAMYALGASSVKNVD
ncbi:MAG: 23S rRNA (guanosine2251-2'-O)-methyltransferase [Flavobacteriales bacterium]|jgi:23S rRNA (guanosine2251-2'-O)-methyltransferase